ncbi:MULTISPECIES: CheR family methyltransferase [unclassified Sphingomonas]|uniref:CheR family methyltransferase n=1 Tax=unclassified Sphingomonas TaxID=196159 RepID=UPI0006F3F745|nr:MULTISPECIES: CheR family methyltransferase [unclassified Sphingomonas]KQM66570.1 chemotaxis protein [Sphingomonas sp. Leaf16]KQN16711.1 chemotaxis protein [Sphingomonas sp. Leaf29]KQN23380.1 chemotaxis protein [Sphingomonas sp. Leaf32]
MHDKVAAHAGSDGASPVGVPVVGIGASAGGLEALREMLAPAKRPTGLAFVVVQHLDPNHESMLAQLLDRNTALAVLQSSGGERIEPDTVYIIPPGRGLAIRDGVLELTDFQQPRGLRRPIDDFFLSLAGDQQSNAACVILSGTGADGTTGLRAIKENGGVCVVQQPESARYDGMPLSAVGTGMIDFVKPPGEILHCLQAFFQRRGSEPLEPEANVVADHVDEMCRILRSAIGHDFSGYKRSTLVRRVERRMHVLGIDTGRAYLARIRSDATECEALFRDLLINVTRFFRDADAFETLRTRVIAPLMADRASDEDVRVWVPGCSSGEEAYTIAMLFAEAARTSGSPLAVQIFATDIDEQMLGIAREGSYPAAAMADVPAHLRERYTVPHAERFTIAAPIRDMIRFSSHSVVKDPPFSRIDLVSCRNLLIYFDDRLQQAVLPLFHYALRPGGFLFLGPSESVGRFEHLFQPVDQPARLFERGPGAPSYPIDLPGSQRPPVPRRERDTRGDTASLGSEALATRRMVERYAPPSLIVDQDGGIISAYGKLSRYFEFPVTRTGGSSAVNLARPGLRNVIGPLLRQARDERRRVIARDVAVETDYGTQPVEIICDPLGDGTLLFVFRDTGPFVPSDQGELQDLEPSDDHLEELEDELRLTRHRLRAAIEELETANEELKSSNEEMMSMNEELQSTNEELSTVNDELKTKVDQLTVANSDLRNFYESTELAVVVLDADLKVRSYTDAATRIFPLKPADRGRPLTDVANRLQDAAHLEDARAVATGASPVQRRVRTADGEHIFSLRVLPYRTQTGEIDGATLVLTEITDALALERQLAAERERLDLAIKAAGIGVWEYCPENGELVLDPAERQLFEVAPDAEVGIDMLLGRIDPDDLPKVEAALRRAIERSGDYEATFRVRQGDGQMRWVKGFGRVVGGSAPRRLVGVSIDVTPEYALAETRELMLREMNHRVKNLFAVIAGMITIAARSHDDLRTFADDLRRRIAALGSAHSLASPAGQPHAVGLDDIVATTLAPYRDHARIEIDGPVVALDRSCLSPLALILHEWATNSIKYGALGSDGERGLRVQWRVGDDGIVLAWTEDTKDTGDHQPGKRGFGSVLVETSVRQLRGTMTAGTHDDRFRLEMRLPAGVMRRD